MDNNPVLYENTCFIHPYDTQSLQNIIKTETSAVQFQSENTLE